MTESKNTSNYKVLLVDDDKALCDLLSEYLIAEGFSVESIYSGQLALNTLESAKHFDAMVLDIMMPGFSGLEVLQKLRVFSDIPVVMLTGRGDEIDRIIGLEMGADDYLGKPCNPRELSARLKAVLRRGRASLLTTANNANVQLHGITLKPASMEARANNQVLPLTSAEFKVLELLMQSAGQVISKEFLTEQVLQRKLTAHDRSIDVHVSRIRQKLSQHAQLFDIIKSIRGAGYQMLADSEGDSHA